MDITIAPYPIYYSEKYKKEITVNTHKWSSPKDGQNGLLTFFKQREQYLKDRGVSEVKFSLYSVQQCKECEIVNADPNTNYYMIRFGSEYDINEMKTNVK